MLERLRGVGDEDLDVVDGVDEGVVKEVMEQPVPAWTVNIPTGHE